MKKSELDKIELLCIIGRNKRGFDALYQSWLSAHNKEVDGRFVLFSGKKNKNGKITELKLVYEELFSATYTEYKIRSGTQESCDLVVKEVEMTAQGCFVVIMNDESGYISDYLWSEHRGLLRLKELLIGVENIAWDALVDLE